MARTRAMMIAGRSSHGPSIKNPKVYEALVRKHMSKSTAAAISNGALNKGYAIGRHRTKRRK